MKLKLKVYKCLCKTEKFTINGIEADSKNFGNKRDISSKEVEYYCCGDMQFMPKLATQEVLDKYKISLDEYNKIANQLSESLSFGSCGLCS
jgi:hypothetical protein